jgi:ketosteroid isomerase-like protein
LHARAHSLFAYRRIGGIAGGSREDRAMADEATLRAMREVNRTFEEEVVGRGDFAALDRVYTRDARILPPGGEMVEGLDAIRAFWTQAAKGLGVTHVRLNPFEAEVAGDIAYEVARGEVGTAQGAIPIKYIVVWKRQDGAWRWHRDIWNTSA